jgi:oxygen-independent coproporphyrinogen-3 oxidase
VTSGGSAARSRFVEGLVREAALRGAVGYEPGFDTVYLGGGTPSALSLADLERLLTGLRERLPIDPGARVFLEANPEDVSAESLAAWRELGVSTLSLGLQSLDDASLRLLGRRHDAASGRRAVEAALGAGFETLSLDLIYARPGQETAAWLRELEAGAALGAQHLSCYQLTFHEGTPFERRRRAGKLQPLEDDAQAELLLRTHERLGELGYQGYEVSSFAREPRHRSSHNRKYWSHVPYLGLGPSAHSFDGWRRRWNLRDLAPWSERVASGADPVAGEEAIGPRERALETLMLGLRTSEGVDLAAVGRGLGRDLLALNAVRVERLVAAGRVALDGTRLRPTLRGLAVADALASELEIG